MRKRAFGLEHLGAAISRRILQRYSRTAATSRSMARFAFRISKPKGRIAFTDWVAHRPLSGSDKQLMAVADLYSLQAYAETRAQAAAAAIGTTPKRSH